MPAVYRIQVPMKKKFAMRHQSKPIRQMWNGNRNVKMTILVGWMLKFKNVFRVNVFNDEPVNFLIYAIAVLGSSGYLRQHRAM